MDNAGRGIADRLLGLSWVFTKLRFWTFCLLKREDVHCAVLLLFFFPFENEVIISRMQRNGEIFIFEKGFET